MKKLFYFFLLLTLCLSSVAGNKDKERNAVKTLSARITATDGSSIPAVKITIRETGESVFSDLGGNFNLTVKTDKTYTLCVESIGYAPLEVKSNELSLFSNLSLKELE